MSLLFCPVLSLLPPTLLSSSFSFLVQLSKIIKSLSVLSPSSSVLSPSLLFISSPSSLSLHSPSPLCPLHFSHPCQLSLPHLCKLSLSFLFVSSLHPFCSLTPLSVSLLFLNSHSLPCLFSLNLSNNLFSVLSLLSTHTVFHVCYVYFCLSSSSSSCSLFNQYGVF